MCLVTDGECLRYQRERDGGLRDERTRPRENVRRTKEEERVRVTVTPSSLPPAPTMSPHTAQQPVTAAKASVATARTLDTTFHSEGF